MNEHVIEYLNYYIKLDNPKYAVLLKGNWGCGKTHFIKEIKKNWIEPADNEIKIQPIYISLNGISNTKNINEKIRSEISPFLYSKGMKVAKEVFKGLLKTTTKIDLNWDNDEDSDGSISFNIDSLSIFDVKNDDIKGNRILIFDDVERCKIPTDEIFGYINHFVEHSNCKVILISDEEKIKERYEKEQSANTVSYKDFKEKLIGQTFVVESDIENAISHFINETQKLNHNNKLVENKNLIIRLFNASNLKNLRVLKQALLDFNRFTTFFDDSFVKHQNYDAFFKHILSYFIIVYAEFKTGNEHILEFQTFKIYNEDLINKDIEIESKYSPILNEYNIRHATDALSISNILKYIEDGFLNLEELNKELSNNSFFRKDNFEDWEELWHWRFLDDKKFKELRKKVWTKFYKGDIKDTTVVFHIAGIFLTLIEKELSDKSKNYIVKRSKQLIDKIVNVSEDLNIHKMYGIMDAPWNKKYQGLETVEFIELKKYLNKKIKDKQAQLSSKYLKNLFEEINEKTMTELSGYLLNVLPDRSTKYEDTAIFKTINGKKLGKKISELDSYSIYDFKLYLHNRYFYNDFYEVARNDEYLKDDLNCLREVQRELNRNLKKHEIIKNRIIKELSDEIGIIVEKIEKTKK